MKLKDIEIKVMSDRTYGDHLNQLFEDLKSGKIVKEHKTSIVARSPEDVAKILTNERIHLLQVIREKSLNPSANSLDFLTAVSPMFQTM